jgi:hypothetical protein
MEEKIPVDRWKSNIEINSACHFKPAFVRIIFELRSLS